MTIKEFHDFMQGYVYKAVDGSDCTNGGVSSKYRTLYVVAEHVTLEDVEELCKENNYYSVDQFLKLDYDFLGSHNYCRLEPINKGGKWYMFGGNYLTSSDSRFKDYVGHCKYPVPILDRYEDYNTRWD